MFYVIRREIIVPTTLIVVLLIRVHVLHVVSPGITSSCERADFRGFLSRFLRYILVKVVEPNPTGCFKRTFKLSKHDMDVVTGFMDTVCSQMYGGERGILPEARFKDVW